MRLLLTRILLLIIAYTAGISPLSAQSYNWVKGGGSADILSISNELETTSSMCVDLHGNIYILSKVGNSAPLIADTFYRPTGAFGSHQNLMFTSYSCSGQMRFAKLISAQQEIPFGLVSDNTGHVYLAMYAFHNSSSATNLRLGYDTTITGYLNGCETLLQYDTTGHLNWIRFVGDNTPSTFSGALVYGSFLAMDGGNNIHFINSMKYGVHITPSITSHWGTYDLTYDVSGNLINVNKLQIDSSLIVGGGTIDKQSNKLYVYGYRNSSMFTDSSDYNYIAALDVSRNLIWRDSLSHPFYTHLTGMISGIASDNIGHLYVSASCPKEFVYKNDTVKNDLSSGSQTVSSMMKLDISGNVYWIRKYSSSSGISGIFGITLMPNNKIAAGGEVNGGYMVSGTDTLIAYSGTGNNAIFTIIDSAGYVHTFQQFHGSGNNNYSNNLVSDAVGNLYIGGQVETSIWAGSLSPYTSIGGDSDYFLSKYGVDCNCVSMPVANYTASGIITRIFSYTGTTTGIDSVRWTFGDGGTSTLMNPTHTYTSAGTFTACIRVYTGCGSDMHCTTFTIDCVAPPAPAYAVTGTGLTKAFNYTAPTAGLTGSISWDFGDGGTGTGTTFSHTYAAAGSYNVCVTAINPCGTNTYCGYAVACAGATDTASYTTSGTGPARSFTYTGTSISVDSVTWDFGDGITATGLTAAHAYAVADTYHICVTVHTRCGNDSLCSEIIIPPTAVSNVTAMADIKVYPNPATNELYINGISQATDYRLLSITGVSIEQGRLQPGNNTVAIPNVASGVYMFEMTGADGQRNVVRIIKQ